MEFSLKKINKVRFGFSFFVLAAILSIVFYLLFSENFRAYTSKMTVIFIPKSETSSFNSSAIIENLVRFPKFLSFYDRMLSSNENLADQFSGLSKDGRKKMWNQSLDISKDDGSTMLKIEVTLKNREQSILFAKQTARTLFDTASFYYNIKTDADFRIVDEPTTVAVTQFWYWLILLSISLGLTASFVLNFIFSNSAEFLANSRNVFAKRMPLSEMQQFHEPKETAPGFPFKTLGVAEKRHQAPENLPIAAEPYNTAFEDLSEMPPAAENLFQKSEPREIIEPTEEEHKQKLSQLLQETPEPTEEELKQRLNKLLRGEL